MVLRNLKLWTDLVKEGFQKSLYVAKLMCFLHVTDTYLCAPAIPYGPSMLPTLNLTGDFVLVERVSTRFGKVGTGDMVLVRSPVNPRRVVIKRIVGMEGDSVTYLVDPRNSDISSTVVVPQGKVWIQGDNIYNSHDSRDYGAVPYGLLVGKVFWRIWPPKSIGSLERKAEGHS